MTRLIYLLTLLPAMIGAPCAAAETLQKTNADPPYSLNGTVTDTKGHPVSGANIHLFAKPGRTALRVNLSQLSVVTLAASSSW